MFLEKSEALSCIGHKSLGWGNMKSIRIHIGLQFCSYVFAMLKEKGSSFFGGKLYRTFLLCFVAEKALVFTYWPTSFFS